ncbi:MAG: hypothetical protein AAGD07_25680 [Planctomycetota bacterium]
MSKRTLLLITEQTLGRFDLSGGAAPSVTEAWVRPSFASQSAGTLADAALRLGKSHRRQVYVLTTRCWTGSVGIGPDLISGASGDDLDQMVALEAETYSGISAFESLSSNLPLPPDELGDHRFWFTQIPDTDLRSIDDALRQAGAKLVGVAHPAIPKLTEPTTPTDEWRSLQTWDESTLLIRGCGEAIADFHSMSSGLQSQRTVKEFETFFQGVEGDATLEWIGPGELPPALAALPQAESYRRNDTYAESGLRRWAAAWMQSQTKQAAGSPLVTIPKKPMSREVGMAIAAVLGLLMMAVCFAHYRHTSRQLADIEANVEQMQGQQDRLKKEKDQVAELKKQRDEAVTKTASLVADTEQKRAEVIQAKQILERGGRRWLSLVDALVAVSDDDGWVREIQSTDGSASIRGLAINDAAVHRFAARLESTSASGQWQILPASTTENAESQLTEFAIDLVAVGNSKELASGNRRRP